MLAYILEELPLGLLCPASAIAVLIGVVLLLKRRTRAGLVWVIAGLALGLLLPIVLFLLIEFPF